ncbi:MAG: tyrosine-type recombinase/integrase [bacterium]|nr:tyrosine-type recombinase/integrase [bacterium]MDE0352162.1 tyrosine-type recombinase/integrase [bacterium]
MTTRSRKGAPLTAAFVKAVQRPGAYGDGYGGGGLVLRVKRSKYGLISKNWVQRVRIGGVATNIGIGSYPATSLREARVAVERNNGEIKAGRDPRSASGVTLAEVTEAVIALHRPTWRNGKTERQWRSAFTTHVYPQLGDRAVGVITTGDLVRVVGPLVHSKPATSDLLRMRLGMVFEWAKAEGLRADNPAGSALAAVLPRPKARTTHHRALPHRELAAALAKVEASRAAVATKLAARFLALTATRTSEVRLAAWSEIEGDTWTIPGERMKSGREHRVPLSEAALDVLAEARERWGGSGLVFVGRGGQPLGHASIGTLFSRLELGTSPHGMRSSFRNWCSETGVDRQVAERALAHQVRSATEAAYNRTDLFERRREVMERWGEYLAG